MYWSNWIHKWFTAALICIVLITGCGTYLLTDRFSGDRKDTSANVINQIRLQVSDLMLYLELNHTALKEPNTRNSLLSMSQKSGISLLYALLDGTIMFNSSAEWTMETINPKTSLHYDSYTSRSNPEFINIAFPVVDKGSRTQVGNAIFIVPASTIIMERSPSLPVVPVIIMGLSIILLLVMLVRLRKKVNMDMIRPVGKLKDYAEDILKGNYRQKAEYSSSDEIGELYAMFDQMRLELMALSERRDAQDQAQKELVTNISHDIKTPLTSLKAYIDAIQDGLCPDLPSVLEYMEVMQTNTNKMARLVDDLLLHALRDLGQISVRPTEQYSLEVFRQILKPLGHYITTSGVTFLEPGAIPNVLIRADSIRLEQVMSNLVANALKHTSAEDSIRISIELEQEHLLVTIADTGKGILPQDMPFIFERYYIGQAQGGYEKRFREGTGLGLSICKHIIEAHQGTISFKSMKGQGTVFYFTLPLC